MSNIEFKDLTFGYGDNLIFNHAQINIDDRWKLGLVGRNGRGKSTLLNLLQKQSFIFGMNLLIILMFLIVNRLLNF